MQTGELQELSKKLAASKVKQGPCESTVEPVLQRTNIQRQKYHGGAFIGNHIHRALQRQTTHDLAHCHGDTVAERCPELLFDPHLIADRYSKLMTLYADCREIFSSSDRVDGSQLSVLQDRVKTFMSAARSEIVHRSRGRITPKLHLLEFHVVPSIRRFGVGLGMLGEQGAESIHAEFNLLAREFDHVVRELDRLKMVVKQHLLTTLPQHRAKVPAIKHRQRRK